MGGRNLADSIVADAKALQTMIDDNRKRYDENLNRLIDENDRLRRFVDHVALGICANADAEHAAGACPVYIEGAFDCYPHMARRVKDEAPQ